MKKGNIKCDFGVLSRALQNLISVNLVTPIFFIVSHSDYSQHRIIDCNELLFYVLLIRVLALLEMLFITQHCIEMTLYNYKISQKDFKVKS